MKLTTLACLIIDFALLILLGAYVVAWPHGPALDPGPPVDLPSVEHGHNRNGDPWDTVWLTIDRHGQVRVGNDEVELRTGLTRAEASFVRDRRARGEAVLEDLPDGYGSRQCVVLRIDRKTRWGAVHPALVGIGAAGFFRAAFSVRFRDGWWNRARTSLRACLPGPVREDDSVTYFRETFGPAAPDLADLRLRAKEWFHENREQEDVRLVVELQPHPDTRFEHVAHVLEVLLDLGLEQIDFLDAAGKRAVVVPR